MTPTVRHICVAIVVSVAASLGIALLAAMASATVGGPELLDVLGYDSVGRKVVVLRSYRDESGRPRELYSFRLDSPHPDRMVREDWFVEEDERIVEPERFVAYTRRLIPLEAPRGTHEIRFELAQVEADSLVTWAWGTVARTCFRVSITLGERSAALADTSFYRRPIGLLGVYDIPGEAAYLAIVRYCRIPFEGGYTVDRPLLLRPRQE
jgi:hypothetical protein